LEQRQFPIAELRLLASQRSAGKSIRHRGKDNVIGELTQNSFDGIDIAFFSAGAKRSREFAPAAVEAGAVVIDNSSAYRMDADVPLVVPEINPEDIDAARGIIANPNCSTIIMLMAVAPLLTLAPIRRIIVSTYQAASGAGAQAMQELLDQTREILLGQQPRPRIFPHPIGFNLFSHNSPVGSDGYNEEERKMILETQKILHLPEILLTATCVRVPIMRAHSESINVEFSGPRPELSAIREAIHRFPGAALVDDVEHNHFPMPIEATGRDEVLVGRVRADASNPNAIDLFACGDQILKGAALNGYQIALEWIRRRERQQ
jgi:aspartate-semialdehyde dehydrogenase